MALDISKCFESTADYRRFADNMFRYTRSKLRNEGISNKDTLDETARDVATDAIVAYIVRINKGESIEYKITYVKTSIDNILKSSKFIKQKEKIKNKTIVLNSSDETMDKASFDKWDEEGDIANEEDTGDYYKRVLSIIEKRSNVTFSQLDIKMIELKDTGLNHREIGIDLNFSEGYVSKLFKKIRAKIPNNKGL